MHILRLTMSLPTTIKRQRQHQSRSNGSITNLLLIFIVTSTITTQQCGANIHHHHHHHHRQQPPLSPLIISNDINNHPPTTAGIFQLTKTIRKETTSPTTILRLSTTTTTTIRGGAGYDSSRAWYAATQKKRQYPGHSSSSPLYSTSTSNYSSNDYPTVDDLSPPSRQQQQQQQQQQQPYDTGKDAMNAFLSRDDRQSFVTKVYAILTGQLVVTVLSVLGFARFETVAVWLVSRGKIVMLLSLLLSSLSWFIMSANPNARRSSPLKWQLLSIFTVGEALMVGFLSSFYSFPTVVSALLATATATGSVTMYTMMNRDPRWDLSQWGTILGSCGMIFLFYGLLHTLTLFDVLPRGFVPYNDAIYSLCGSCLFTLFLARTTRLIVSGKHSKFRMNENDYVYGAMCLYSDIVNVFIYMLRLLGEDRDG